MAMTTPRRAAAAAWRRPPAFSAVSAFAAPPAHPARSAVPRRRPPAFSAFSAFAAPPAHPTLSVDEDARLLTIAPAAGVPHTATVVGPIHGLGDTARGWLEGALHLYAAVPHCKMLLPDAPVQPVTLNGGMRMPSWYDIQGLGDRFEETCAGLDESRARITALIDAEIDAGMPPSPGFPRGARSRLCPAFSSRRRWPGCW